MDYVRLQKLDVTMQSMEHSYERKQQKFSVTQRKLNKYTYV
ncbi:hypothetical protein X975_17316, partial [Stegodyphus mimosarum]